MTKWCPFCLLYNNFFCFLLDRTGRWGSASYMLCFACTGGNALLQASVYFIPNRSHCCTEGIFFLFRVNHAQRKANVQKIDIFAWNGTNSRPGVLWCCRSSNMGTNVSASAFGQIERFPQQL